MSSARSKTSPKDLVHRVMAAGRENGTRGILFQQTVGQILGLSATDMKCLDLIAHGEPANPSQLAELTGLTTGAVTVLIDRLEGAGLIERRSDPNDRRKTRLMPTEKAGRLIPSLYRPMGAAMHELVSSYSDRDLKAIEHFFIRSTEVFKKETDKLRSAHLRKKR